MKKSIFNIALLSMLFIMGACSTDPDKTPDKETPESNTTVFLNSVKTKDALQFENKIGTFSSDGRTFDVDPNFSSLGVSGTLTFYSASSGTEATYFDEFNLAVTITLTSDGGTITVDTTETIFTYVSVVDPDPNATAFLNSVKTKDAFQFFKQIGTFDTDGKTFVVDGAFSTLGVSGTLTFESAISGTEAIYLDESSPAKEVTITTLTADGGTITVDGKVTTFTYSSAVDPNKETFLNSVTYKDAFQFFNQIGNFSYDGETFEIEPSFSTLGVSGTLTFELAISDIEAIYLDESSPAKEVTITLTSDGGTITVDTTETIFTYEGVVNPNVTAFLNSVKDKDAFQSEKHIGKFSDYKKFKIEPSFLTLGVSGTLTFESASSGTEAIYLDESTPAKEVTITLTADGGTITVDETETIFTYIATIGWQTVGTAGFSANRASDPFLAIDKDGVPYVAYQDAGNGYKATVMKFVNGTWTLVGTALDQGTPSLAIDKDGVPYVAYQDVGNGKKATVKKFVNNTWTVVGTAGFSTGGVSDPSLVIDRAGVPYVAYSDNKKATVMKFDSGTWTVVGKAIDQGTPSLAINGVPYVAYADYANGSKASVKKFVSGAWTLVGTANFSAAEAFSPLLALDKDGDPYVAYADGHNGPATVMKLVGDTWTLVGTAGVSAGKAVDISLAINKNGVPYVAYRNDMKSTVKKFVNNTWTLVGKAVFSTGNGSSLAIDKDGVPYMAYSDDDNSYKVTVMKYDDIVK